MIPQGSKEQNPYQKETNTSPKPKQKEPPKATNPTRATEKIRRPSTTRVRRLAGAEHVFISQPKETTRHKSLHLITAFEKLRRITKPTVYQNPPYHSGMTQEPRTSTVFINLEDHRTLPGNMTPTTEEHFQRLYWRLWGFKQLQRASRSFRERQSI
ncbi:hypothetical protein DY000_02064212 [Brassica cretica]|uniref:Uncharacterized protein n=1 Tax=Brassica cretica TaxID=69181 RepID=A0ABQ7AY30_BRACR|nr:hypothetical protein DY000_02064212 [Brassica cretica]